jgi:hypothetical protein
VKTKRKNVDGMDACKHNPHGGIVWPKGATPLTVVALKQKLTPTWKDLARWGITLLGKGFYEFSFSSLEDVRRVRTVASWNLDPGYLKLFAWSGDFNPNLQKNTTAQVWVRLYGLSQEYWRPKILFAIASSVGTSICTDAIVAKTMFDRTFGHYARILVDMDLSQTLRYKVLVERKGYAFFVELDYENMPDFCIHCQMVGHYLEICKRKQYQDSKAAETEPKQKPKQKFEGPKQYVQTNDGRVEHNKVIEVVQIENSNHTNEGRVIQNKVIEVVQVENSNHSNEGIKSQGDNVDNILIQKPHSQHQDPDVDADMLEQQNMFMVLSGDDVEVDKPPDQEPPNALSENLHNSSSTGDSEFVNAT